MKQLKIFLFILSLLTLSQCFVFNGSVTMREGKCVYGKQLKENTEIWYNPNFCERLTCQIIKDKAFIIIKDCGVPAVPDPSCEVTLGKGNYPDCCPRIECNDAIQN